MDKELRARAIRTVYQMLELTKGQMDANDILALGMFFGDYDSDVKALHKALDEITSLFVSEHGFDYAAVKLALAALNRNRDRFPLTLALAEKLDTQ